EELEARNRRMAEAKAAQEARMAQLAASREEKIEDAPEEIMEAGGERRVARGKDGGRSRGDNGSGGGRAWRAGRWGWQATGLSSTAGWLISPKCGSRRRGRPWFDLSWNVSRPA